MAPRTFCIDADAGRARVAWQIVFGHGSRKVHRCFHICTWHSFRISLTLRIVSLFFPAKVFAQWGNGEELLDYAVGKPRPRNKSTRGEPVKPALRCKLVQSIASTGLAGMSYKCSST